MTEGSIPAMRVRYIVKHTVQVCCGFSGSIPAMRVRYIGKTTGFSDMPEDGSIPAMRVRYILGPVNDLAETVEVQFPLCG